MRTNKPLRILHLLIAMNLCACSDSKSTNPLASTGSAFSKAFPLGFAVSSPTSHSAASGSSLGAASVGTLSVSADDSFEEKQEALEEIVTGTTAADCTINVTLASPTNASCYGPNLTYVNHPNAPTPDANTTDEDSGVNDTDGEGQLPGGDLGIWTASQADGEACAAAQLNSRIQGIASQIDAGMFTMAGLMCAANVSGQSLPAIGASLDLSTNLAGHVTINSAAVTVTTATITRAADSAGGDPVYVSTVVGTAGTKTYTIRLKHSATAADNSTYLGKLSLTIADADGTKPGNCGGGSLTGQTDGTSISYELASATSLKYEAKSANFCGTTGDPFVSTANQSIDLSKKFNNSSLPTGWGNNANYFIASFDPTDLTGSFAYAWQAGVNDGNTRAFLAKVESAGASATAWFGFGPAADDASVGTIDRMICNWAGPNQSHTGLSKAQQQVMTLTSGKFTATSSNIVYDPTNTCTSDGTDGSGHAFSYSWDFGGTQTRVGNASAMDLVNLSTVTSGFTAPTAPTNVDL